EVPGGLDGFAPLRDAVRARGKTLHFDAVGGSPKPGESPPRECSVRRRPAGFRYVAEVGLDRGGEHEATGRVTQLLYPGVRGEAAEAKRLQLGRCVQLLDRLEGLPGCGGIVGEDDCISAALQHLLGRGLRVDGAGDERSADVLESGFT